MVASNSDKKILKLMGVHELLYPPSKWQHPEFVEKRTGAADQLTHLSSLTRAAFGDHHPRVVQIGACKF